MRVSLVLLQKVTNVPALVNELKCCGNEKNLTRGKQLHDVLIQSGDDSEIYVANTLISMYSKCGSLNDARRVFNGMQMRAVISWNALIWGCADNGEGELALDLFVGMTREGLSPNGRTYLAVLKACSEVNQRRNNISLGKVLHLLASSDGCDSDTTVENTLVDMYAKSGYISHAHRVFDGIKDPDVVSWNTLIFGYGDAGEGEVALELFQRVPGEPDSRTYVAALRACIALKDKDCKSEPLERGKAVHLLASCNDCDSGVYAKSTLINMYVKCKSLRNAERVFEGMVPPNMVSWNALMLGYADNNEGNKALELFSRMGREGFKPNERSFSASFKACIDLALRNETRLRDRVKELHLLALRNGQMDIYVESALVDIYSKCRMMEEACRVFENMRKPDVVSWTALILGYADNRNGAAALDLFSRMRLEGCPSDATTFLGAFRACIDLAKQETYGYERGRALYLLAASSGCESNAYVKSIMVEMCVKFGDLQEARKTFETLSNPDVVSWTSLILGYVENGQSEIALDLFKQMQRQGCVPDSGCFSAALKACALLGSLEVGKEVHAQICSQGVEIDVVLATSLVDFYAKCGSLVEAEHIFKHQAKMNLLACTALMSGYSRLGDSAGVFSLFRKMVDADVKPDAVAFSCILTTCSHAGLVEEGRAHFKSMTMKYAIPPDVEHYTCMVDLLGRANHLDDAMHLLRNMPFTVGIVAWSTLLGACRTWKNGQLGKLVYEALSCLDDKIPGVYVQMANLEKSQERAEL